MKLIVILIVATLFITKLTEQDIDSGTGAGALRRPVIVKQQEWVSLDLTEDEINASAYSRDTLSTIQGHNH